MKTQPWNPWTLFDELERTMFAAAASREWPVFDIEDSEQETTLTADLPGMTESDIELTIVGPMLTVHGERKAKEGHYVARQRFSGTFEKQFRIGEGYDLDDVKANITNGVLTINLAKAAKAKPRRIKLGTGVVDKVKSMLVGEASKQPPYVTHTSRP
ncbi:Hsp20/alpha crystallin family protein [soil metagenome]